MNDYTNKCCYCKKDLPQGLKLAFYDVAASPDVPFLGDFCSVNHAFSALANLSKSPTIQLPQAMEIVLTPESDNYDKTAYSKIMADLATKMLNDAVAGNDLFDGITISAVEPDEEEMIELPIMVPPSRQSLN